MTLALGFVKLVVVAVLADIASRYRHCLRLGQNKGGTIHVVIIADLTIDQLLKRREARQNYQRLELETLVDWFNEKQRIFGVNHVLVAGVESYCEEIIQLYT
ncbi:MAG TPA: hypothetical protein VLQ45_03525 [Thermoanaerobaculia bacterium]|nr:hypothetical protein [Thermoanaerobaculia bacterium]